MGKNLHSSILPYWERALNSHTKVKSWDRLPHTTDYIYLIVRISPLSEVVIHVSDEYRYNLTHYHTRPPEIKEGAIIYLAKPESDYALEVVDIAVNDGISIGKYGEVLGALNINKHWTWEHKDRKALRKN